MKLLLIFAFSFIIQNTYGQSHNVEKITDSTTSLYFDKTEFRGFKYKSVTYFVNDNLQTITAIKDGKIVWTRNVVLECEGSKYSKSQIEIFYLQKAMLHARYKGKDIWIQLDGNIFVCG